MATMSCGEAANSIERNLRHSRADSRRLSTFEIYSTISELHDVWKECSLIGWDGHGALPVEQETYRAAYCLIDSLPLGFPMPSIGAEPDGQLTMEWRKSPRRVLSVSIDPEGFLHYAGLFGMNKRFGTIVFFSNAPDELLQLVREL